MHIDHCIVFQNIVFQNMNPSQFVEHGLNVAAKRFWVANCALGFLAEMVRVLKLLSSSDQKPRVGGSLKASLVALWFYFADAHASMNLCGYRKDSELRIGSFMTLAALTQLFNMWPSAGAKYASLAS